MARGDSNSGYVMASRAAKGRHEIYRHEHSLRQKHSKTVYFPSKRADWRLGLLLTAMLAIENMSAVAANINERTNGPSIPNANENWERRRKEGRKDGKAESAYPKQAGDLAFSEPREQGNSPIGRYAAHPEAHLIERFSIEAAGAGVAPLDDALDFHRKSKRSVREDHRRSRLPRTVEAADGNEPLSVSPEPMDFITERLAAVETRPELVVRELLAEGIDPWKEVQVGRNVGAAVHYSTMPLLRAALEKSAQKWWMGGSTYAKELVNRPDETRRYYDYIDSLIEANARDLSGVVVTDLHIAGLDIGKPIIVHLIRYRKSIPRPSDRVLAMSSRYGYILEAERVGGEKDFFAVSVRGKDRKFVWTLPADSAEREDWVKLNRHLFSDDGVFLDIAEDDAFESVSLAVEDMSSRIMDSEFGPLKETYLGKTDFEETVDTLGSWFIPFHDTAEAVKRGAYWEAFTHAATGIYLQAFGGQGVKQLTRAISVTVKGIARAIVKKAGQFSIRQMLHVAGERAVKKALAETVEKTLNEVSTKAARGVEGAAEKVAKVAAQEIVNEAVDEAVEAVMRGARRTSVVTRQLNEINDAIIKNPSFGKYLLKPKEKCAAALEPVMEALKKAGYTVKVRGMEIWTNGMSAIAHAPSDAPMLHFVVVAKKAGHETVVDLTAGQFERYGLSGPIIAPLEDWMRTYRNLSPRLYIRMRDCATVSEATDQIFHVSSPRSVVDPLPGGRDLTRPAWLRQLPEASRAAAVRPKYNSQARRKFKIKRVRRPGRHHQHEHRDGQ